MDKDDKDRIAGSARAPSRKSSARHSVTPSVRLTAKSNKADGKAQNALGRLKDTLKK